jgi:hypothetical protein
VVAAATRTEMTIKQVIRWADLIKKFLQNPEQEPNVRHWFKLNTEFGYIGKA